MNTKNWTRHLAWGVLGLVSQQAFSQASQADNNGGFGSFLGWNAGANQVLEVKNEANQPIQWFTDAIQRMMLQETATYGIGQYNGQVKEGALLLCPDVAQFYTNGAPGPYSLLHLAAEDGNASEDSYRPWMNTGITFTGNRDHGYVGQKAGATDYTDMIVHWADNPGEYLKDRMRFLFTSGHDANATHGAQSLEGLEFMRMWPDRYENPHIGVGDFFGAALTDPLVSEPTERLDMVNGRLRIRQLPNDSAATDSFYVMVVDRTVNTATNQERGVVKWVDPDVLTGAPDCDWTIENDGTSGSGVSHNVYTAVGSSNACPDLTDRVGIGTASPQWKVDVFHQVPLADMPGGLRVWIKGEEEGWTNGILGYVEPDATNGTIEYGVGIQGSAVKTDREGYGMIGKVIAGAQSTSTGKAYGVQGQAHGNTADGNLAYLDGVHGVAYGTSLSQRAVGVYGSATGGASNISVYGAYPGAGTNDWAGYFDGDVTVTGAGYIPGGTWNPSDETLKTNVEPIIGASDVIAAMNPMSYEFLVDEHPNAGLPVGYQAGLMIQDVEPLLPHLVRDVAVPALLDSMGNELAPAETIKAMNYTGLIPYLIGAIKEQHATIAAMQEQLAATQELVAACCANPDGSDQRSGSAVGCREAHPRPGAPAPHRTQSVHGPHHLVLHLGARGPHAAHGQQRRWPQLEGA